MLNPVRGSEEKATKRRRIRACDQCRRRKVRCDGGDLPAGQRCGNCIAFGYECTYVAASDKRFADVDYVQGLEREVQELRARLAALESASSSSNSPAEEEHSSPTHRPTPVLQRAIQLTPGVTNIIEEDVESAEAVVELLENMKLDTKHTHFLGRSSSLAFVRTAMALKQEYSQSENPGSPGSSRGTPEPNITIRKPEYWDATSLLVRPEPPYPPDAFPNRSLLNHLIEAFFTHLNVFFPLLHRPTFEQNIADGLHLRDDGFGATVLLVCAVGSRFASDDSVLPPETKSWHWAGWPWFRRVSAARKLVHLSSPSVYDLQACVLLTWYIASSPVPHAMYAIIGHGIRLAQDMGAHRRTTYGPRLTVEDELKKRAFWCLIGMERGMCDKLGRPYNIHDEDFDIDFPVECDDEYWINDDPELAFKQPPGKPSTVTMFVHLLRLGRILAHAYRTIYCIPVDKSLSNPDNAQRVVSELDSELNRFITSIPEHLRLDNQQDDFVFSNQSALLYATYYTLQITVHRSFVPLPRRPSPLSFPSLAICTNAARSCIRLLERQYTRLGSSLFLHWHQMSLFTCSIIVLLNVWHGKIAGIAINVARELEEVRKAMMILQALESRWSTAARLWDILNDIVEAMHRPVASLAPSTERPQKRRRDDGEGVNEVVDDEVGLDLSPFTGSDVPPPLGWAAGRPQSSPEATSSNFPTSQTTVDTSVPTPQPPSAFPESVFDFTLPLHTDELGRLPIWADESLGPLPMATRADEMWAPYEEVPEPSYQAMLATPVFADSQSQPPIDPELEAIFAEMIPDGAYGHPFGMVSGMSVPHGSHPPIFAQGFGGSGVAANQPSMFTSGSSGFMMPQEASGISSNGAGPSWSAMG